MEAANHSGSVKIWQSADKSIEQSLLSIHILRVPLSLILNKMRGDILGTEIMHTSKINDLRSYTQTKCTSAQEEGVFLVEIVVLPSSNQKYLK